MGIPDAVKHATIAYGEYENTNILNSNNTQILKFYKRCIDDNLENVFYQMLNCLTK